MTDHRAAGGMNSVPGELGRHRGDRLDFDSTVVDLPSLGLQADLAGIQRHQAGGGGQPGLPQTIDDRAIDDVKAAVAEADEVERVIPFSARQLLIFGPPTTVPDRTTSDKDRRAPPGIGEIGHNGTAIDHVLGDPSRSGHLRHAQGKKISEILLLNLKFRKAARPRQVVDPRSRPPRKNSGGPASSAAWPVRL